jgi:hypothetical protein
MLSLLSYSITKITPISYVFSIVSLLDLMNSTFIFFWQWTEYYVRHDCRQIFTICLPLVTAIFHFNAELS